MTRDEVLFVIEPFIETIGNYQCIPLATVEALLGKERAAALLKDPIRKLGPTKDTIYPWNVADYLQYPELGMEKR